MEGLPSKLVSKSVQGITNGDSPLLIKNEEGKKSPDSHKVKSDFSLLLEGVTDQENGEDVKSGLPLGKHGVLKNVLSSKVNSKKNNENGKDDSSEEVEDNLKEIIFQDPQQVNLFLVSILKNEDLLPLEKNIEILSKPKPKSNSNDENSEIGVQNNILDLLPPLVENSQKNIVKVKQKNEVNPIGIDNHRNDVNFHRENIAGVSEGGNKEGVEAKDQLGNIHVEEVKNLKKEFKAEELVGLLTKGSEDSRILKNGESPVRSTIGETGGKSGKSKIMTGEDYLNNLESFDKKDSEELPSLSNLKLLKSSNLNSAHKTNPDVNIDTNTKQVLNPNIKGYGQAVSLTADSLVKNINIKENRSPENELKNIGTMKVESKNMHAGKSTLKSEAVVSDVKHGDDVAASKQNLIPMISNKDNHGSSSEMHSQESQKVLDLGTINTGNVIEIIKKISDYVEQNQVANKNGLDLLVKHESLGEFKIQVSKMPASSVGPGQSMVDMQITTSTQEGHDFFVKNEMSLIKNLNNAGINLADLRIVNNLPEASLAKNDFGQSNSQNNADSNAKQFMSFDSRNSGSEFSSGKEKRKDLWEEYQQRYGA